jgi:hypothetical protein
VVEAGWEDAYARLREYAEREGHSRVPDAYRDDEAYQLGKWVGKQRQRRKRGTIAGEQIRRLEALPGWVWTVK